MNTLTILKAARKLISKPENWTQHSWAKTRHGDTTPLESPNASCWCAAGAIKSCGAASWMGATAELAHTVGSGGGTGWILRFNGAPTTTHAMVLRLFDKTIARLEADHG